MLYTFKVHTEIKKIPVYSIEDYLALSDENKVKEEIDI